MKSPATYAGDPRHHVTDLAELRAEVERLRARTAVIQWAEPDAYFSGWPKGYMTWLCRCGAELSVRWTASCSLYDSDDPIKPEDANTDRWQVECHNGHVLLLCHEWAGCDEAGDTFPAPTTAEIVERLASTADVAKWRASWTKAADA